MQARKIFIGFMVLMMLFFGVFSVNAAEEIDTGEYEDVTVTAIMGKTDVFALKAKSSVLMVGNTGRMIIENDSHKKLPIASVTKIMSMLLIMEAIDSGRLSFEDQVTASEHACSMGGSQVWLEPGEVFTVQEMLQAVAIASANDCTVALAEKIAGSEEAFVAMMNEKAKELGMNDTNFLDCTGLTDTGHYSSAHDVALMSRELLMKHPKISEFSTTWMANFREGVPGKKPVGLNNTNKLIRYYEGADGLKTGFTNAAGFCLSAAAKRDGLQLIAVVLGEPDSNTRFAEARKLLDYGFANYEVKKINSAGEVIKEVCVSKGLEEKVNAVYATDVNVLIKKGSKGTLDRVVNIPDTVTAPVQKGQKLGEVIFTIDEEEVGKVNAVADRDVKKSSFVKLFCRMVVKWFSIGRVY